MDIYREHILDHYQHPRNRGALTDATHTQPAHNPLCGDSFKLYLKIIDGRIAEVTFDGHGCAISTAAASLLTERIKGQTIAQAAALTDDEMLEELAIPLSPARLKCGLLAISGLRTALTNHPSSR